MSYILDALKKAAEQRDRHGPALRRLMAAPAPAPPSSWSSARRLVIGMSLGAAGAAVVLIWALRPGAPIDPPAPADAPRPAARTQPIPEPRRAQPVARLTVPTPADERPPAPPPSAPRAPESKPPTPPLAPAPPVVPPAPPSIPAVDGPAVPAAEASAGLRLEVIVYSDVAADRMVFINGRKYVQGDIVADRARLEEIQPEGVVLSEEGRRFTLRQSRP